MIHIKRYKLFSQKFLWVNNNKIILWCFKICCNFTE